MIEVRRLTKSYGSRYALRDVTAAFEPARITAIVGPNAAGKTTLIKSLLGLVRPTCGEVRFDGSIVNGTAAFRAKVGYMPQTPSFPANLTGNEVLDLLRGIRGASSPVDEELLDTLRLGVELEKPARALSGGTRQKLNAACAFLFAPEVLILDEPTAGLDPLSSSVLKDKIVAERCRGRTVILTSHVVAEIEELAEEVVFLMDGAVRYIGPLDRLKLGTREHNLERAIATIMREVAA